jgi:hypothetical protein
MGKPERRANLEAIRAWYRRARKGNTLQVHYAIRVEQIAQ